MLLHVGLPLALGLSIYLLFRKDDIALFRAFDALGLRFLLDHLRPISRPIASLLPRVVLGSAPDAAWAYAFGAALSLVWARDARHARDFNHVQDARIWIVLGFVIAIGVELAQLAHLIEGVFDPVDLGVMAGAYALGALATSRVRRPTGPLRSTV
ncbi:hypothetical protein BH09MYX1_BH09MYX1_53020 [soil metagenome]